MYIKYTPAIPLFVSNKFHPIFCALVVLENQAIFAQTINAEEQLCTTSTRLSFGVSF